VVEHAIRRSPKTRAISRSFRSLTLSARTGRRLVGADFEERGGTSLFPRSALHEWLTGPDRVLGSRLSRYERFRTCSSQQSVREPGLTSTVAYSVVIQKCGGEATEPEESTDTVNELRAVAEGAAIAGRPVEVTFWPAGAFAVSNATDPTPSATPVAPITVLALPTAFITEFVLLALSANCSTVLPANCPVREALAASVIACPTGERFEYVAACNAFLSADAPGPLSLDAALVYPILCIPSFNS
jgi:hypothetical protein